VCCHNYYRGSNQKFTTMNRYKYTDVRGEHGRFVKGNRHSDEVEAKRREGMKEAYRSGRRLPSRFFLGKALSPEHRANVSAGLKGKKLSQSHKQSVSEGLKRAWQNPEFRARMKSIHRARPRDPVTEARRIAALPRGEKHCNWKGGILPLVRRIRNCWKMQQWKRRCRSRDNFACVSCGIYARIVDHIDPFSQILSSHKITTYEQALACPDLWDISNGRTVCQKHHTEIQAPYRRVYAKV